MNVPELRCFGVSRQKAGSSERVAFPGLSEILLEFTLKARLTLSSRKAIQSTMNRELIRQQLVGRGPFRIRTSDGKEFSVPHPEFVLIGRHNIVIENTKGFLDIIDPLHVVSIRPGGRRKNHKTNPKAG